MSECTTFEFPNTVTRKELLIDGRDTRLRRLLYDITALAERIEQMRTLFAREIGVTKPQYSVLFHIAQHQGDHGITAGDVASGLYVSRAHVTKETSILIDLGLLKKIANPSDGRSVLLRITNKGGKAVLRIAPTLCAVNDRLFASLSSESFEHLADTMKAVLCDAEKASQKLPSILIDQNSREFET